MTDRTVYDTRDLLGVYYDVEEMPSFWRMFFPMVYQSDKEEIEFSKITDYRHLAPLVLPTAQGRPTYKANERLTSYRPGYLKPKDTVKAAGMLRRRAGQGELGQLMPMTPEQRYNLAVALIMEKHRRDIERRWEWMAAEAILNGKITLEDDGYPRAEIDFQRASNHTVTLTGANTWDTADVDIVKNIDTWVNRMTRAKFGASPNIMIVGPDAWDAMVDNSGIQKLLDRDIRNTSNTMIDMGVGDGGYIQHKGNINANLPVYSYAEQYEVPAADGTDTVTNFMNPKDICLVGTAGVMGYQCFGAIQDVDAEFMTLPVFPKMWRQNDPSATVIMCQSAPLMVPVNPNATLRATVLA